MKKKIQRKLVAYFIIVNIFSALTALIFYMISGPIVALALFTISTVSLSFIIQRRSLKKLKNS